MIGYTVKLGKQWELNISLACGVSKYNGRIGLPGMVSWFICDQGDGTKSWCFDIDILGATLDLTVWRWRREK